MLLSITKCTLDHNPTFQEVHFRVCSLPKVRYSYSSFPIDGLILWNRKYQMNFWLFNWYYIIIIIYGYFWLSIAIDTQLFARSRHHPSAPGALQINDIDGPGTTFCLTDKRATGICGVTHRHTHRISYSDQHTSGIDHCFGIVP